MGSARNIIFITCLLSGICYSNAAVTGGSFFIVPGSTPRVPYSAGSVPPKDVTRKFAEELICGDTAGWANHFRRNNIKYNGFQATYNNPCGLDRGKCVVNDDMTDYDCECFTGYKFNSDYEGRDARTCIKSKSLVTCNPGTRRVAAEKLIVGKLDGYNWVSGTYERVAGTGYDNENIIENINQGTPVNTHPASYTGVIPYPGGQRLQQYRHDVPIKGREYYVQYKVDADCDIELDGDQQRIPMATLSFNYKKNQWQFTNKDTTSTAHNANLQVYSREAVKCVEDATEWFYTYVAGSTSHFNVGMVFVPTTDTVQSAATILVSIAAAAEFQIRDIVQIESTVLEEIRDKVEEFKALGPITSPSTVNQCLRGTYLRLP